MLTEAQYCVFVYIKAVFELDERKEIMDTDSLKTDLIVGTLFQTAIREVFIIMSN